jgi:hypothetical protein
MLPVIGPLLARRRRQRKAASVTTVLFAEPAEEDVLWLAEAATDGDVDHARWELRYARRALGLLVAQRDALDDRTASDVGAAIARAFAIDPSIAPDNRSLAERQYNERVTTYRETMQSRGGIVGISEMLGRTLLLFASNSARAAGAPLARATALMAQYEAEAGDALRKAYGA